MNKFFHKYVFLFFLGIFISRREILGSYSNSMFNIWGTDKLLSIAAELFYNPISNVWAFQFLCICANTYYYLSFKKIMAILESVKWYLTAVLTSLMINILQHISMCLLYIHISSWGKFLFKFFAHFNYFSFYY